MRTHSPSNLPVESPLNPSTSNPKRRNRRRSKPPIILDESPVDTMAGQRTMAKLLHAPTESYAEAIVVPSILAEQFVLKHRAARRWTKKEPSGSILTWEELVSKFINEFFPLSRTTNLRNEISNFQQRFDESFHEAWDRYKDLLCACPHHGFTELHKLDTFYNALNPADQDSLNFAAGGNLLERRTQDVLMIIKNKSKVHNSRNKSVVSQVKSSDANSNSSSEIAKLTHVVNQQTSVVTTAMTAILKQFQATPPLASVKVVEEVCVTCCGDHPYYQCLAADGNTFSELKDNIQGYVAAAAVNYNQAITTRSGIVLDGPSVPIPPPFINTEEDERVEETLTDQDLAEYTIKRFNYGESKVHIEVLSVLWGNRVPIQTVHGRCLDEGTITLWNELREAFIIRYFSPTKFRRLLNEIHCFHQLDDKDNPTQGILDARGIFLYNTPNEAFKILEDKVLLKLNFSKGSHVKPQPKIVVFVGGCNINSDHAIFIEKLEALATKINSEFLTIRNDLKEMREGHGDNNALQIYMKDDTPVFNPMEANYGDVKLIEEDKIKSIPTIPNPNPIMSNSPTISPYLKDCIVHISYTTTKTFADNVLPDHVGDEELNSTDGVGTGSLKKETRRMTMAPEPTPPSPNYIPGPEHTPSPNYVPGPEEPEQALLSLSYVPKPEYPEYLVPSDAEESIEDKPLPDDASPIDLSPGYIAESDPEEDRSDYPANGGDDAYDEPADDDDEEVEEQEASGDAEEEEDEYSALANSSVVLVDDPVPLANDTKPFKTDESAPTPIPSRRRRMARMSVRPYIPFSDTKALIAEYASTRTSPSLPPSPLSPLSSLLPQIPSPPLPLPSPPTTSPTYVEEQLGYRAVGIRLRATSPSTNHPSEMPSSTLLLPSTTHRDDFPEVDMSLQKRACFTAPTSRFEDGESSLVGASKQDRQTLAHTVHYGFIDTMGASIRVAESRAPTAVGVVNDRVTNLATT
nr:hypothetical protein [Tanacetum cinerariifolium]